MPSQGRSVARDKFFETLDEPEHVLTYGGINGEASVPGMPGRVGSHDAQRETVRYGLHSEPVPVMLRDAVTIDTAVRLTGVNRITLQRAAHDGQLPHLKLGPDNAPYLVRLRDVIVYMITMWTDKRARAEMTEDNEYLGFPEWLVNHVSDGWPDRAAFKPGKWQGGPVKINRGGRPKGYNPVMAGRPGFSKAGKRLGRPPVGGWPEAPVEAQKREGPDEPAPPRAADTEPLEPVTSGAPGHSTVDPTTLPKWHPQWRRTPAETAESGGG